VAIIPIIIAFMVCIYIEFKTPNPMEKEDRTINVYHFEIEELTHFRLQSLGLANIQMIRDVVFEYCKSFTLIDYMGLGRMSIILPTEKNYIRFKLADEIEKVRPVGIAVEIVTSCQTVLLN
jgi:hypothetical protein